MLYQDLFSGKKIFVLENLLASLDLKEGMLEKLVRSENRIILLEEKADKRSSLVKSLLADKNVEQKIFDLPHGKQLDAYIVKRAAELGGRISPAAADLLARKLETQETKAGGKVVAVREIFNLWQAENEIGKLLAYCVNREVGPEDVSRLVSDGGEVDVLQITNAIGEKNKQLAMRLIGEFLSGQGAADEKAAVIQLNALLAEQFRNVAAIQSMLSDGWPESRMLEATGWKSGRLFVIKKISGRFAAKKITDFLGKLEHLDQELKSSSTPPKVLLDLIVSQLLL